MGLVQWGGREEKDAFHTEIAPPCVCPCAHGRPHATQLYQHVPESRWPIVYSPRYNITFMGLEKLHPFDAGKWGKVISFLKGMQGPMRPYMCFFQPTFPTPVPRPSQCPPYTSCHLPGPGSVLILPSTHGGKGAFEHRLVLSLSVEAHRRGADEGWAQGS